MENERPQHECGIFGYYSTAEGKGQLDAASVVLLGLESLQHRSNKFILKIFLIDSLANVKFKLGEGEIKKILITILSA